MPSRGRADDPGPAEPASARVFGVSRSVPVAVAMVLGYAVVLTPLVVLVGGAVAGATRAVLPAGAVRDLAVVLLVLGAGAAGEPVVAAAARWARSVVARRLRRDEAERLRGTVA